MLNISKQIYVGWDSSQAYKDLPEAEVIPLGESATEKKKLDKFVVKHDVLVEHDNVPLPGFTLYEVNKKHYSQTDSSWLVIDPRGFLTRISQDNMETILKVTGITEGLIQERCVWAREDSSVTLSLVPISSALYNEAVNNTDLIESKVDMADVNIGDTVLLQNKLQGTYLGVYSLYCTLKQISYGGNLKVQGMLRRQVVEVGPGKFHYGTDIGILKVINKALTPGNRIDTAVYLNNIILSDPGVFFTPYATIRGIYYGSEGRVKFVSTHAAPVIKLNLEEIDKNTAADLFNRCRSQIDQGVLVVEGTNGNQFLIDYPWWGSNAAVSTNDFMVREISSISDSRMVLKVPSSSSHTKANAPMFSLDNFAKFYKIVKSVKHDTYI